MFPCSPPFRLLAPAAVAAILVLTVLSVPASAVPTVVEPGWTLVQTIDFANGWSAHYNPVDGCIYVNRGETDDGLYRIDAYGYSMHLANGNESAGVVVDPVTGNIFWGEHYGGIIYRTALNAVGRTTWVSGLHDGDDDPVGMAIAPATYTGDVLLPGQALVVDRGNSGLDEIWVWSPATAEGEFVLHADNGTLIDAVDVAIDDTGVFVVDSRGTSAGLIYEVHAGGALTPLTTSQPLVEPEAIAIDPWNGDLLLYEHVTGEILRMDRETGEVSVLASGLAPVVNWAGLDISPDGRRIILTDRGNDQLHVLARCDAAGSLGVDCNYNGVHDYCEIVLGDADDCNRNGLPDSCDLTGGVSGDCNLDGVPDECPVCPPVEVVFIMDTSTSMDAEAGVLCNSMGTVVARLEAAGLTVLPLLLGICDLPGGSYACLEDHVTALLGTAVPGDPPPALVSLGACPGGLEVCQEDWGLATAVVAGVYPWQPPSTSVRIVIPLADEGAWCGDPVTVMDQDAVAHAIKVARTNDVIVSPITGSGSSTAVLALAQALADSTGGQHFSSSVATIEIADAIVDLVLDACAAFTDCNGNDILDECDIAGGSSLDANGNGVPDECESPVGVGDRLPSVSSVRLAQNVPNPFNPTTVIHFDLPRPGQADLSVFTLDGRRVATLIAGHLGAGPHEAVWNGRDGSGHRVASGAYVYRLWVEGEVQSRRLVLLK